MLANQLFLTVWTRTRDAIVADVAGLTRDRHCGLGRFEETSYLVVDTGGFEPMSPAGHISFEMAKQTLQAIDEADVVVFMVDARVGVTPQDLVIADHLRRCHARVVLTVNKAEGMHADVATSEFYELGFGQPVAVSASHGEGVGLLLEQVFSSIVLSDFVSSDDFCAIDQKEDESPEPCEIAVVGRPNVGKSTLSNVFLGQDRLIVFDHPGTTRDSIAVDFYHQGECFTLIDTAGVRRKSRVSEAIEKFSVIKTLQSIQRADVALLVLDASQDVADQDASLANFVIEAGKSLVVVVNKWDLVPASRKEALRQEISRKLYFLDFAKIHFVSAKNPSSVPVVLSSVHQAHQASCYKFSTPRLTRVLKEAVHRQVPAYVGSVRPKMRYAHQGGMKPPVIVIHGHHLQHIQSSYTRYLEKTFRKVFKLEGTPIRIEYKYSNNPYVSHFSRKKRKKG